MADKVFYTQVRTYLLEPGENRWDAPNEIEIYKGEAESSFGMQDTEAVKELVWEADNAIDKYREENCKGHVYTGGLCDHCDKMEPKS